MPFSSAKAPVAADVVSASADLIEKVAATKAFFETLYNSKEFSDATPRSLRRRRMERTLYDAVNLAPSIKADQRRSFFRTESNNLRQLRVMKSRRVHTLEDSIDTAGFEPVRVLGKGSFGVVRLVREISECPQRSPVYAMKVIRKSDMLRNSQEGHLRAERDFLVSCAEDSKWVVPLLASFQDMSHLYLVMEYEIGSDFLGLLLRRTILGELATRFYIAEMILCLEEAHKMQWIHRDVKPDNFLISSTGHLKISDFGLAFNGHWSHDQAYYSEQRYALVEEFGVPIKGDDQDCEEAQMVSNSRRLAKVLLGARGEKANKAVHGRFDRRKLAKSVVGTSQYMAPEVVRGSWYDGRCDWWSVGIILFECLWGFTPFCREDREATKKAILEHDRLFVFPTPEQEVSTVVQDLIFRLLQEPESRLCSHKYQRNDYQQDRGGFVLVEKNAKDYHGSHVYADDAEDIKRHPFFQGLDWDNLHLTPPPWIPRVSTLDSTKYFDSEEQILGSSMDSGISLGERPEDKAVTCPTDTGGMVGVGGMDGQRMTKDKKPKRRPRDKLLRDPVVAKTVMYSRKRGAFLGYTYRRPQLWTLSGEMATIGSRSRDTEGDSIMSG